mmetsp:Transcript_155254/g.498113  ORF Transcript_155254/g.498113 Transcript_155254/m.498113 type:complete len:483 (-) Transcript_155254:3-1451(-)
MRGPALGRRTKTVATGTGALHCRACSPAARELSVQKRSQAGLRPCGCWHLATTAWGRHGPRQHPRARPRPCGEPSVGATQHTTSPTPGLSQESQADHSWQAHRLWCHRGAPTPAAAAPWRTQWGRAHQQAASTCRRPSASRPRRLRRRARRRPAGPPSAAAPAAGGRWRTHGGNLRRHGTPPRGTGPRSPPIYLPGRASQLSPLRPGAQPPLKQRGQHTRQHGRSARRLMRAMLAMRLMQAMRAIRWSDPHRLHRPPPLRLQGKPTSCGFSAQRGPSWASVLQIGLPVQHSAAAPVAENGAATPGTAAAPDSPNRGRATGQPATAASSQRQGTAAAEPIEAEQPSRPEAGRPAEAEHWTLPHGSEGRPSQPPPVKVRLAGAPAPGATRTTGVQPPCSSASRPCRRTAGVRPRGPPRCATRNEAVPTHGLKLWPASSPDDRSRRPASHAALERNTGRSWTCWSTLCLVVGNSRDRGSHLGATP